MRCISLLVLCCFWASVAASTPNSTESEQVVALQLKIESLEALRAKNLANLKQFDEALEDIHVACDHIWLLMCGALVFFMQAGFAMVEAGLAVSTNLKRPVIDVGYQ